MTALDETKFVEDAVDMANAIADPDKRAKAAESVIRQAHENVQLAYRRRGARVHTAITVGAFALAGYLGLAWYADSVAHFPEQSALRAEQQEIRSKHLAELGEHQHAYQQLQLRADTLEHSLATTVSRTGQLEDERDFALAVIEPTRQRLGELSAEYGKKVTEAQQLAERLAGVEAQYQKAQLDATTTTAIYQERVELLEGQVAEGARRYVELEANAVSVTAELARSSEAYGALEQNAVSLTAMVEEAKKEYAALEQKSQERSVEYESQLLSKEIELGRRNGIISGYAADDKADSETIDRLLRVRDHLLDVQFEWMAEEWNGSLGQKQFDRFDDAVKALTDAMCKNGKHDHAEFAQDIGKYIMLRNVVDREGLTKAQNVEGRHRYSIVQGTRGGKDAFLLELGD